MHSSSPNSRRRAIAQILAEYTVRSQSELGELLTARKISVNQATLSRDLRDLGVVKGPDGYAMPTSTAATGNGGNLIAAVEQWLLQATAAQNQVVLSTPPGGAQALGLALDQAGLPSVVGTIAGDDTVLVICPNNRTAVRLARELLAGEISA